MTPLQLLTDLRARGVVLSARGDRLAFEAPAGVMTPDLRAVLASRKPELLAMLAGNWGTALRVSMQRDFEDVVHRSASVYEQLPSADRKALLPALRALHDRADRAYQTGSWAEFQTVLVETRALLAEAQPDDPLAPARTHWLYRAWSQVLDAEVWFVHCEDEEAKLASQGIQRGSIYTEAELAELLRLPQQPSVEALRSLHAVKAYFDATVVPIDE